MEKLVLKSTKGTPITTSLLIAEKFGKEHKNVIQSIKEIIRSAENSAHFYHSSTYNDSMNRLQEMFIMTRDGFSLLVMGFTGDKALQFKIDFINAFNKMEFALKQKMVIPGTYAEALQLAADQAKQIELQQSQMKVMEPKVLFADSVATSDKSVLVADLAKVLRQNGINIGQNRLFERLREKGYLCSKGEYYNQPTQYAMELGLFEIKKTTIDKPNGTIIVSNTTKVTGKGLIYFVNKFLKYEGMLKLV